MSTTAKPKPTTKRQPKKKNAKRRQRQLARLRIWAWAAVITLIIVWVWTGSLTWAETTTAVLLAAALIGRRSRRVTSTAHTHWTKRRRRSPRTARSSLEQKIGPLAGYPPIGKRPHRRVVAAWPKHPDKPGATITVEYASAFAATTSKRAALWDLISAYVPAGGDWEQQHDPVKHQVSWVRGPNRGELPDELPFTRSLVPDPADPGFNPRRVPLGVVLDGDTVKPLVWDIDLDPHMSVFGKSGSGKSNMERIVATHVTRVLDALIIILDPKNDGDFNELEDHLPNVRRYWKATDMASAVCWAAAEMERRQGEPNDGPRDWRPLFLVIDECAAFTSQMRRLWAREKQRGDPPQAPALEAYSLILQQGRSTKVHLVAAAQYGLASNLGGGEARSLLSCKFGLGDVEGSAADHIFVGTPPPVGKVPLRGVVEQGGVFSLCQTAWLPPPLAVDLAALGAREWPDGLEPVRRPALASEDPAANTHARATRARSDVGTDVGTDDDEDDANAADVGIPGDANTASTVSRRMFDCPTGCSRVVVTRMKPGSSGARCKCGWRGRVPKDAIPEDELER